MKSLNIMIKSLLGIMVVLLLAGVWVMPAAAAEPEPPERDFSRLEYLLKLALIRVEAQQDMLDTAGALANVAEEFIVDEQAKGFDTSKLEAALSTLRSQIDEAQSLHDSAAEVLAEKAGFDEDGQVVDPRQAGDTLRTAHRSMRDAGETLRRAQQDFRQAFRDYRQDKRGN
jgi:hypothetical protein